MSLGIARARIPDPTERYDRDNESQFRRALEQALQAIVQTASTIPTVGWTSGTGSPETVVTAPVGALYSRLDGGVNTTLYVKQTGTGNTGWAAK